MSEFITLHIGTAGVGLTEAASQQYCLEHGLGPDGKPLDSMQGPLHPGGLKSVFRELPSGKFAPRSLLLDLDHDAADIFLRRSPYRGLFSKETSCVLGKNGGCWQTRARWSTGKEIAQEAIDAIRHQAEACNTFRGCQIIHSLVGGTGSGLTSLMLERLTSQFGSKLYTVTFSLAPSRTDDYLSAVNFVLTNNTLVEHCALSVFMDNTACASLWRRYVGERNPMMPQINELIAHVIANFTSPMRLMKGPDFLAAITNLVPYPRIHNVLPTVAGLLPAARAGRQEKECLVEITKQLLSPYHVMLEDGKGLKKAGHIAMVPVYRGALITSEAAVSSLLQRLVFYPTRFDLQIGDIVPLSAPSVGPVDYVGTGCLPAVVSASRPSVLLPHVCQSGVAYHNSCVIQEMLTRIAHNFDLMYSKRAFIHWYIGEGMESGEFSCAREDMAALKKDYEVVAAQSQQDWNSSSSVTQKGGGINFGWLH